MATKNKAGWIKDIIVLDNENKGLLGDIAQSKLETFTVGQLKALHKDMADELAEKSNADTEKDDENLPSTDVKETDGNDTPKSFASMCGNEFDPKKTGTCYKQCQVDFPEAFKACSEHYATLETVGSKRKSSKPSAGKSEWGHTNGKQGGLIDNFFFEGQVGTMAEICDFCGGKEGRVMHHMKHLVADKGVQIQYKHRKVTEGEGDDAKTTQVKEYWWHDKDKRRKGDNLSGKSAYPNK